MSIYHCSVKIIGRTGGRSAVSAAAYRAGEKLKCEETGLVHDYTKKDGVVMNEIILPENAPKSLSDRETLWNEVQSVEKRKDAQLAREVEVAFPVEMNRSEQIECVRAYIMENFVSKGMIADWAFHDKGDGNPHAHILLTMRGFDEDGGWTKKQRSVFANSRDENGRAIYDPNLPVYDPKNKDETSKYRIPVLDKDGKQKTRVRDGKGTEYLWEKISIPANDWNDRSRIEEWRQSWAEHCNRYLEPELQIDHRSYKRQGLEKEPGIHEGVTARKMEVDGHISERCEYNREISERNSIRESLAQMAKEIIAFIIEKVRELYERIGKLTGADRDFGKTGRDDLFDGGASIGEREAGVCYFTEGSGDKESEGEPGRNDELKREIEQREQEYASTVQRIEQARQELNRKERDRDDRIRKLMERRRSVKGDGSDAGPDRGAAAEGSAALIRDIRSTINVTTGAEKNSGAERKNREDEQRRLDLERQREIERRNIRRNSRGIDR